MYRLLDEVLRTGEPIEIERAGRRLRIVSMDPPATLSRQLPDQLGATKRRIFSIGRLIAMITGNGRLP